MSILAAEIGRTVRYSLAGWARTIRLCVVVVVITILYVIYVRYAASPA
jgi:hypothetical protein